MSMQILYALWNVIYMKVYQSVIFHIGDLMQYYFKDDQKIAEILENTSSYNVRSTSMRWITFEEQKFAHVKRNKNTEFDAYDNWKNAKAQIRVEEKKIFKVNFWGYLFKTI